MHNLAALVLTGGDPVLVLFDQWKAVHMIAFIVALFELAESDCFIGIQ